MAVTDSATKQIETLKLLQRLKQGDEKPGSIILRALHIAADREAAVIRGINALTARYPHDLAFANAGFTLGVVRTIVDAALSGEN
jgi:hypothetical protein